MTKITVKGKTYILRYDMTVVEWMEEKYGDIKQAFEQMHSPKTKTQTITDMFIAMANCANDYLGVNEVIPEDFVLFDKHASLGRVGAVSKAIMGAIADGNRMQTDDEDDATVHDEYLKELNEQEKNRPAGS